MLKVAIVFTVGCSVLVCNAVLSTLPLISGLRLKLPAGCIYVEGVLSVLSCTLFLIGSTFAFVEAWRSDAGAEPGFTSKLQGTAYTEPVEEVTSEKSEVGGEADAGKTTSEPDRVDGNGSDLDLLKHAVPPATNDEAVSNAKSEQQTDPSRNHRRRYLELQIFANIIFLCSSALYCATAIASLVTIIQIGTIARCIRYPQLVAAGGFTISSLLLIFKIQRDSKHPWWKLKIFSPGLHVNFWNLVGSTGFVFCAYFGLLEHASWAQEQFGYSYLWGSWAFLLGSVIEWYKDMHRKDRGVEEWKVEKSPV